jgi:hypothetical protein
MVYSHFNIVNEKIEYELKLVDGICRHAGLRSNYLAVRKRLIVWGRRSLQN